MGRGNRAHQVIYDEFIEDEIKEEIEESPAEVETPVPPTVTNGVIVNSLNVNMRNKPDLNSDVLEVLRKGDKVTILGKENGFHKVSTKNHSVAYISSDFIKEE